MAKTLILTGWGYDSYAYAAAEALQAIPKADVLGVSQRRLPEVLEESGAEYAEIYIVGVCLTYDPERLGAALKMLRQRHVDVHWISVIDPGDVGFDVLENLDVHLDTTRELDEWVISFFNRTEKPIRMELSPTDIEKYSLFIETTGYFHRNVQNDAAYADAIKHLARKDPESKWRPDERQMCETYALYGNRELKGHSALFLRTMDEINAIAQTDARVLILGESGTGKENAALQIHLKSARSAELFEPFNCAMGGTLLESELFGYKKGAFTGATEDHKGLFQAADGGTLFLDEIGELPLSAQAMLLRVLEVGRVRRVGDTKEEPVDVRIIAATNRNLAQMVKEGKFREDLYWRLCVFTLRMPSLRERKEDIYDIVKKYCYTKGIDDLSKEQYDVLMEYDFPGNVRELLHLLERAEVMGMDNLREIIRRHREENAALLDQTSAEEDTQEGRDTETTAPERLDDAIRLHVQRICKKYGNNISQAAKVLDVARNTVKKYL